MTKIWKNAPKIDKIPKKIGCNFGHFIHIRGILSRFGIREHCIGIFFWQHGSPLTCCPQLRYLQTLNSISAENNSTIVFPIPIDIMSHFMKNNGQLQPPSVPMVSAVIIINFIVTIKFIFLLAGGSARLVRGLPRTWGSSSARCSGCLKCSRLLGP